MWRRLLWMMIEERETTNVTAFPVKLEDFGDDAVVL